MQINTDAEIKLFIQSVKNEIIEWATSHDLWHDSWLKSHLEQYECPQEYEACVLVLCSEGSLYHLLSGFYDDEEVYAQFEDLLNRYGLYFECNTTCTIDIMCANEQCNDKFLDYFRWEWICHILKPDISDLNDDIYSQFRNSDDLLKLDWRQFEILLAQTLQSNGFEVELGTGRNDKGVDLHLFQRDPLGDILTLVQAKRYGPSRKINIDAVAALHGVRDVENAQYGMFITTSSYLPSARQWAARTNGKLLLKDSSDVISWCQNAASIIIADKTQLSTKEHVSKLLFDAHSGDISKIIHTSYGYNSKHNGCAIVLKETKHAALIMDLRTKTISDDGYGQRGLEVPDFGITSISNFTKENTKRVLRKSENGHVNYWDGTNLYSRWDGESLSFDYYD